MNRKTTDRQVSLKGTGLHTGEPCAVSFIPSQNSSSGIRFARADISGSAPIPAVLANVSSTVRGTNLLLGNAEVSTVEHLLSCCAALGITDLDILLDGPEPPITDGSAAEFVKLLLSAGTRQFDEEIAPIALGQPVEYRDGDVVYAAEPAETLSYGFVFVSAHPLIKRQEYRFEFSREGFIKEIAPARTFGFEGEIEALKKAGLAKGGSLENAVLVTKDGFLSAEGGLRFPDELARHKILDLIGDMALLGRPLGGMKITAIGGGHKHNVRFAKQLLEAAAVC